MTRTTNDTTTTSDQALASAAGRGDQRSFEELHRRHAPQAWRLGWAVTGDPDRAVAAVAQGTGTLFTALRMGRFQTQPHGIALAASTRNAALDQRRDGTGGTTPVAADDADALLAAAFGSLPERWRSVLWLRDAEGLSADQVAPVVELSPEAVDQLAVRARRGLRERYLRAQLAGVGSRNCNRAITRLGAFEDGTLNDKDRATLERHLRLCAACTDRHARIAGLHAGLPALLPPVPADRDDRAAKAWRDALATTTSTGLSPRTEKVLAGASAFAAAVGIIGATMFGGGSSADPVASPLAPLVADISAPRPVDLAALTLPLTTPDPITSTARRSLSPVASAPASAGGGAASGGGEVAAAPADGGTATPSDPGTPAAEAPQGPVQVDLDDGVTVGPITVDPTPSDGGPVLEVEAPAPLAPVVDPVQEVVNTVATPVLEAAEPVTQPAADAVKPVTEAVNGVIGNLGL